LRATSEDKSDDKKHNKKILLGDLKIELGTEGVFKTKRQE
jgi:hypothetical protein